MHPRKTVNRILILLVLAAMLFTNLAPVTAQNPGQGGGDKWEEKIKKAKEKKALRITQKQRQEAADAAKAKGFVLPKLGVTPPAARGGAARQVQPFAIGQAPHYFSHPNYANSPYPVDDRGNMFRDNGSLLFLQHRLPGSRDLRWRRSTRRHPQVRGHAAVGAGWRPCPSPPRRSWLTTRTTTRSASSSTGRRCTLTCPPRCCAAMCSSRIAPTGRPSRCPTRCWTARSVSPRAICGVTAPSYLGPAIVAQKDTPVRILFRNLLPAGQGGDLFIPTDTSVMGAGMGPDLHGMPEVDPQNPTCEARPRSPPAASPRTAPTCTCTAASRRGSATARRTSGSPRQARRAVPG